MINFRSHVDPLYPVCDRPKDFLPTPSIFLIPILDSHEPTPAIPTISLKMLWRTVGSVSVPEVYMEAWSLTQGMAQGPFVHSVERGKGYENVTY